MQITIELPEDIAVGLESRWKDLPRAALESLALEAYRSGALTAAQLGRLLVFETRMQVDAFLKEHEIFDYSAADFDQDRETLRQTPTSRGSVQGLRKSSRRSDLVRSSRQDLVSV